MDEKLENTPPLLAPPLDWRDRKVQAKEDVRFYRVPGWHPERRTAGILFNGETFDGGIHNKVQVGDGHQYQVSDNSGARFWITTNPEFVKLV